MRVLALVLPVALACFPTALEAQARRETSLDLFAAPSLQLQCREEKITPTELGRGVSVVFRFLENPGSPKERELDAGYTDQGTPVYLLVTQNVPTAGQPFALHAAKVIFGAGNRTAGFRVSPENGDDNDQPPKALRQAHLSEREISRARELIARLWAIRCGKPMSALLAPW